MYSRYSQLSNFPINVVLMQATTNHETFPTGSDQVDFEAPSNYRTFPISVKDKMFYVDANLFSRNSEFFGAMMENTNFLEGNLKKIEINDENPEDIQQLIGVLSPNYLGLYPDEINEENVCTILRLCDKYLISNLKQNCLDFLENFDPSSNPISSVLFLFHRLCFSLTVEIEHDTQLAEIVTEALYTCLTELIKPSNAKEFRKLKNEIEKNPGKSLPFDKMTRIMDAIVQGNALFEHRLSYTEEVQGLGCHQCSKRPPRPSRFNHGKAFVLCLCKSCNREVCVQCRKKPCLQLFDDWINELQL